MQTKYYIFTEHGSTVEFNFDFKTNSARLIMQDTEQSVQLSGWIKLDKLLVELDKLKNYVNRTKNNGQ